MMTLSGSGCSGLPPPARPTLAARCVPVRGPGGTFVLWVREGGTLELCASLTGSCCLASKAARRALRRCTSAHNAAMSASFSCSESRVRSGKLSMLSLSDTATLLVKRVVPSGGLSNYLSSTNHIPREIYWCRESPPESPVAELSLSRASPAPLRSQDHRPRNRARRPYTSPFQSHSPTRRRLDWVADCVW